MPSTYTTALRFEQPADGEQDTTWGETINRNLALIDNAIAGRAYVYLSGPSLSLTALQGADDQWREPMIVFAGSPGAPVTVTVPAVAKHTRFVNTTLQPVTVTTGVAGGASFVVQSGCSALTYCDTGSIFYATHNGSEQAQSIVLGTAPAAAPIPALYGRFTPNDSLNRVQGPFSITYSVLASDAIVGVQLFATSDRRTKTNIRPLDRTASLAEFDRLADLTRSFAFRATGRASAGWIAQELVAAGLGELVAMAPDSTMEEEVGEDGAPAGVRLVLDHDAILPRLVLAVAELRARAARPWWRRLFG